MEFINNLGRPVWAEVNLTALSSNIRAFRNILPGNVQLMAVIKADGYGHGAYETANIALKEGASMLGVASLEEGVSLRQKGIKAPVLILGYTEPSQYHALLEAELIPTIFDWEAACLLSGQARELGRKAAVHVKLDTGMGRLGLSSPGETLNFLEKISQLPFVSVEGVYTHFAAADEQDKSFTKKQLVLFQNILDLCNKRGIEFSLKHAANSAATIEYPETHFDMVRIGIGLFGYFPSGEMHRDKIKLSPVMSLKSRVVYLKKVAAGTPISYGRTYAASKDTTIATVALGYGDGYSRLLSNKGYMLVRGKKAPVAGTVCMDYTMLDVGMIPGVAEGDEVVACGRQGEEAVTAEDLAEQLGTISYEILCNISGRVPRVYI